MNYLECIESIKKGQLSYTYYFYGTEAYMIEALKQALFTHSMEEEERETNVSIYDLEETSIQEVVADAETFPFLGDRKLIFATNPTFLKAKNTNVEVDHQPEMLVEYLENPAPYTIFVLLAPYEKLDERKKLVKRLKKKATTVSCQPLKEWDMDNVIERMTNEKGVSIEKEAVRYIIYELGTDLMVLNSELDKLSLYVGEGNQVRLHDAELLVSHQENSSAFKLMDAIMANDLAKAIDILKDLEKMNEEPIALLALIASQFRTLLQVKLLKQKGYNQKQMAQQLKIHPYVAKLSVSRQEKFSLKELKDAIALLAEADMKMKTGQTDKSLAFELLLYQLVTKRKTKVNH
ncbi:DNA polymerase III subunit delta [Gracilibacillus sp. YIM 98692]|uniref:DNA polymerase III subunit delta n=1 Tax=Gracilibacillus sp. YIM 98692 TaxID=2663532 RepID=UPI0013D65DBE|nr:DNA polymerase III subunit delta [Gracilibacillus sp. YIM 98692]